MKRKHLSTITCLAIIIVFLPGILMAQGEPADYERANNLREKFQPLVFNTVDQSGWIEETPRFWYRKSIKGGSEFNIVDAAAATKKVAFDHEKLAASLVKVLEDEKYILGVRSKNSEGRRVVYLMLGSRVLKNWTPEWRPLKVIKPKKKGANIRER